jgi:hypothetical protein
MLGIVCTATLPLRVVIRPGSPAEAIYRKYAAHGEPSSKPLPPQAEAVATGFRPRPALNLRDGTVNLSQVGPCS